MNDAFILQRCLKMEQVWKQKLSSRIAPGGKRHGYDRFKFRPRFEQLEDRTMLSIAWVNPNGGDWDTSSNWFDGSINRLPISTDDVLINTSGITVTHS